MPSFLIKDKYFYRQIALLAAPIAAQNIITYSVGLADNVMVGSLGEVALSGVYLANQITSFLQMMVMGFSAAMLVLATQYWGKNDGQKVKSIIGIALKFCLAVSLLLWAVVFFFPVQVLSLFGDDPAVLNAGAEYIRILCFAYPFFCLTNILISSMRCVKSVRIGMLVSTASLITDLFLNWVMIFGHLGFPALGIKGAALSTLITRVLESGIMVFYVFVCDKKLKIRLSQLIAADRQILSDFFRYGFPVIAGDLMWGVNLVVQGAIVGHLGAVAISAVSIVNTVYSIVSVGIIGLREASSLMIGTAVGADDIPLVKQYARTLQFIFVAAGLVTSLIVFFTRDVVLLLYPDLDAETVRVAKELITVMAVTVLGTAYQMSSLTGIVRAGGATRFVLINDLLFVWLVVLPSSALAAFVFRAAPWIVYACLKCDQILKCIVAVIKVNRFKWIKNLTRANQT